MIDGDINEFINDLHYGIDLYVRFNGNTYSFQGWDEGEMHTMLILQKTFFLCQESLAILSDRKSIKILQRYRKKGRELV